MSIAVCKHMTGISARYICNTYVTNAHNFGRSQKKYLAIVKCDFAIILVLFLNECIYIYILIICL